MVADYEEWLTRVNLKLPVLLVAFDGVTANSSQLPLDLRHQVPWRAFAEEEVSSTLIGDKTFELLLIRNLLHVVSDHYKITFSLGVNVNRR